LSYSHRKLFIIATVFQAVRRVRVGRS